MGIGDKALRNAPPVLCERAGIPTGRLKPARALPLLAPCQGTHTWRSYTDGPLTPGWAFIEQYRRTAKPAASIILLSALRDAEATATQLHLDGFISKPFELGEVSALVRRCISRA